MIFHRLSFKGGIYPPGRKEFTQHKAIEKAQVPQIVTIPLQQHIGAPCEPIVKRGDYVKMGQKIGEPKGYVSAPVHSSVSGRVKSIELVPSATGSKVMAVVIENDGLDALDDTIAPANFEELSPEDLKRIVLDAGIVGMGGAAFPTHVKLSPPEDKKVDFVILNGAECEPYITADHRLMLEEPELITRGLKIIMKILGVDKACIGIEDNKPDAIDSMKRATAGEDGISIQALKTKYPQGAEKQLISAITGRQVPSGGLPADVGVIVSNVATAAAICKAVETGMPLIERVVTVSGKGIKEPKNLLVRIGTSFEDVINQCGGMVRQPARLISGGPMTGIAQYTTAVPVTKGTSGILVLTEEEVKSPKPSPCIRCGKCVQACPINLMPLLISGHALRGDYDATEELYVLDCIECGSCSFVCPSKRPLYQSIQIAKKEVISKRKRSTSK